MAIIHYSLILYSHIWSSCCVDVVKFHLCGRSIDDDRSATKLRIRASCSMLPGSRWIRWSVRWRLNVYSTHFIDLRNVEDHLSKLWTKNLFKRLFDEPFSGSNRGPARCFWVTAQCDHRRHESRFHINCSTFSRIDFYFQSKW